MAENDTPPAQTLYLIDGHAQIFRAYYAIRAGMTSPVTGEPTNALFGFTGMLLKLFDQFHPQYVAMAMDAPGPTFRDEIYPEYKAQREAPPEDFSAQIPRIQEITQRFGIPIMEQPGAEADDIIATIVRRILDDPRHADVHVRLVSKDKDLEQLLCDRVTMFDIHTDTTIDADWLLAERGIRPEQVVDLLALTGDNVDNVPGVKGIGPKTAGKLLQEFGSIDALLGNLEKIKGKRRENIEAAAAFLPTARRLVTLNEDVDIPFDLEDARAGGVDAAGLRRLFKELGFNRHLRELDRLLGEGAAETAGDVAAEADGDSFATTLFDAPEVVEQRPRDPSLSRAEDCDYRAIMTQAELDELVATLKQQELIAVDVETIGLGHRSTPCGVCLAWQERAGVYVPMCSPQPETHLTSEQVLEGLRDVLEDPAIGKCGHNLKYDMLVLRHAGVRLRGVVFDSMIGAFLLNAPGQGMDHLALALLKHETIPIAQLIGAGGRGKEQRTMDQVPLEQITPYAAEDADLALRLTNLMRPQLKVLGMEQLAAEVEMPLIEVLAEMETHGVAVDPAVLDEQKQQLNERIDELRVQIHEAAGEVFNVDSPRQLADVLFSKLKLPVVKKTKTGSSTDYEVLERLRDMDELDDAQRRVPELMVEYRQLTKLVGTYLEALRESIDKDTKRIHATFHQTGAATGRLSSSGPNLQNIPIRTEIGRQIRKAFVADHGHLLLSADYSQIELRMLAHLSDDAALIEAFAQGQDIHTAVAAQVFNVQPGEVTSEQRGHAKTINFGIIYGVTPWGLARRIDGLDVEAARTLINDYRTRFKGIDRFLDKCIEHAKETGYVQTILGRRREIKQIASKNGQTRALGERLAINTVVQGSAADLIKLAMVNLHRRIEREALPIRMLIQIHDELVVELPADRRDELGEVVRQEMEQAMSLKVPLTVELGAGVNWLDAK